MGFSISWVGFKGLSRHDVLQRIGFRDSGREDEANEAPFSLADIPNRWVILFANDVDYGAPEHLVELSAGAVILSCQAEEHVMVSAAYCYVNGREAWSVRHDGQQGRNDLSTRGALPAEFGPISARFAAKREANDAVAGNVDYTFDIPVALASELTGYRHDRSRFDWGKPHFTALERVR